jgi:hypothetical protein
VVGFLFLHTHNKGDRTKMAVAKKEETIEIPRIDIGYLEILLIGDSPLIMHKWSEKAKKEMLDKQMKVAKKGREAKDPQKDYEDSIYHHPDGGYGFPSVAFKNAAVSACRFTDGTKMTVARGAFHVEGEFVKIEGSEPNPREDMVRVGMGTADIRYRAEFQNWNANVRLAYNKHALSKEQIVNLFNLAGFGVGVGEWRPEKDGQFGRFHVGTENEVN